MPCARSDTGGTDVDLHSLGEAEEVQDEVCASETTYAALTPAERWLRFQDSSGREWLFRDSWRQQDEEWFYINNSEKAGWMLFRAFDGDLWWWHEVDGRWFWHPS